LQTKGLCFADKNEFSSLSNDAEQLILFV